MTGKLPSAQQFKDVLDPLQYTRDAAFAVAIMENGPDSCVVMREICIKRLKDAVAILGYEIVERVPATPQTPDKGANASVNDMAEGT